MTYTAIAVDMLVIPGLLPRGGRILPVPGIGGPTVEAEPTDRGLEFKVDGEIVTIPWARVQWTRRAAAPVHAPGAEAFARAVIASRDDALAALTRPPAPIRQPAPREKGQRR